MHRGKIVEAAVRKVNIDIAVLAKRLHKTRGTIYRWFENPDLGIDKIIEIGKIIQYDFTEITKKIPGLNRPTDIAGEPITNYYTPENQIDYQIKYIKILENYNKVLAEEIPLLSKKIEKLEIECARLKKQIFPQPH